MRTAVGILVWTLMLPLKLIIAPAMLVLAILEGGQFVLRRLTWYIHDTPTKGRKEPFFPDMLFTQEMVIPVCKWPFK